MSGHTPGPWRLAKQPPNIGITVTLYGYGPATLGTIHTGNDEYIANAILITAAPDMLAALKAVVAVADRKTIEFDAARAAIAKAEGA